MERNPHIPRDAPRECGRKSTAALLSILSPAAVAGAEASASFGAEVLAFPPVPSKMLQV